MEKNKIKNPFLSKLFFSKIILIDKPGVIVSQTSRFFGCVKSEKRSIYHFKEIFDTLQSETFKKLGKKESSDLFYKIGKDLGVGFLILGKAKQVPKFMLPQIIDAIYKIVKFTGTNSPKNLMISEEEYAFGEHDSTKKWGEVNKSFFAGVYSGFLTYLSGGNFDAIRHSGDSLKDKIIIRPSKDKKYKSRLGITRFPDDYNKINIIRNIPPTSRPSFSSLIKFEKITSENSETKYEDEPIFATEQSMFWLIAKYYKERGLDDFFKDTVIKASEDLAKKIFNKNESLEKNFEKILNTLCAFGWGIPKYSVKKNEIEIIFLCAPISFEYPIYRALIINGFLNSICVHKYSLEKMSESRHSSTIKIYYSKS